MLTRFKVSGFKNLVDVDVYLGPFTCIAGANGVGKSNLFDAILFLSALSEKPLMEAASSVRNEEGKGADIKTLFHRTGDHSDHKIYLEAEMIAPEKGTDDLGVEAIASITFLRYSVELRYKHDMDFSSQGGIELVKEELSHINMSDAVKHLLFPHKPAWRKSVVKGRRQAPLISTGLQGENISIKLHQDRGESGGIPRSFLAKNLPRTVLSTANATESKTALMAKREMQSWRILLLEPSALRRPDKFNAPDKLASDGSHLPAALYRLSKTKRWNGGSSEVDDARVYSQIANRLSELIDDVSEISIDIDEKRELLTLEVKDKEGTSYSARDISDGTLRFLAAAVIEMDSETQGLLCLEEPENGIHPSRIPAMLRLLQDIAVDVNDPIGPENPLRQVIINTHSPSVVAQVIDESLLIANLKEMVIEGRRFRTAQFCCLPATWRAKKQEAPNIATKGDLLPYLNPVAPRDVDDIMPSRKGTKKVCRVVDREDLQEFLPFTEK